MNIVITMKLSKELKKELEKTSKELGISKSAFIRMAIIEKMNRIRG